MAVVHGNIQRVAVVHLPDLRIAEASSWMVQAPHLYTAECTVTDAQTGDLVDAVNTTIGVRSTSWDYIYDKSFFLNNQNAKIRRFCHHDDFTGVGMAVPDRIWLLTAMQNRGTGANAWRTSHNNYRGSVYDIADIADGDAGLRREPGSSICG